MDAREFYNTYVDWSNETIVIGAQRGQRDKQDVTCHMSPDNKFKVCCNFGNMGAERMKRR